MTTRSTPNAPQQQRSREMLQKLLRATLKVLAESGLAGATIPRIAATAEVAPASIYRRFADKDALLRAAILDLFAQANHGNREHLHEMVVRGNLQDTVRELMAVLLQPYRAYPQLMRALKVFFDNETDQDFLDQAQRTVRDNMRLVEATLLVHRKEIKRGMPERAVNFALMTALGAIETIVIDPRSLWHLSEPLSDEELVGELTLSCVAYLKTR
jgi:AcrR family transcriptional regulator